MIHYWSLAARAIVIFTGVPIAIGLLLGLQGWYWHREAAAFVDNSRAVVGRIIEFRSENGDVLIDVEQLDEEGVPYRGSYKIPSSDESTLRAAGNVNMVYDVRNPKRAQVSTIVGASNEALLAYATLAMGAGAILYGLVRFLREWRRIETIRRLFAEGALVKTEVREVAIPKGSGVGRFTYAFRGTNGRWFEGKSPEMTTAALGDWPVGRKVIAAFDPGEPKFTQPDVFEVLRGLKRSLPD
ncbi:MAG: hypothetical protein FJW32_10380 [Acidobacteria bacterium]|nr:hypothetical protein [Acidobacteriota bacterium]